MKEILLRVRSKFKTNLSPRRGSPTKYLPIYPRPVKIGCLTLDLKGEEVVILQVRNLGAPNVVRNIWVDV